jgi:hypothetical protein
MHRVGCRKLRNLKKFPHRWLWRADRECAPIPCYAASGQKQFPEAGAADVFNRGQVYHKMTCRCFVESLMENIIESAASGAIDATCWTGGKDIAIGFEGEFHQRKLYGSALTGKDFFHRRNFALP